MPPRLRFLGALALGAAAHLVAQPSGATTSPLPLLELDPARIERAALHATTFTGGAGEVKDYFKLNGRHYAIAEGHDHHMHYTVFPVEPRLLRQGDNTMELRSDTEHHGIELLTPGPALVVRYRK